MQIHDFLSNKIINYKTLSYDILIGLYVHIVLDVFKNQLKSNWIEWKNRLKTHLFYLYLTL